MASTSSSTPQLPFRLPKKSDGTLIPWLEAQKKRGRPVLQDMQMKLNLAFVLGYQWVVWNGQTRAYQRPTVDTSDPNAPVRIKSNKIAGLLERTIAKLTKEAPLPEARPVSDDDNDVDAARVGTRILSHELDRLKWPSFLQKFLFWPGTLGWSYVHIYWNAEAGKPMGVLPSEEVDGEMDTIMEGAICLDEVPAFELSVAPGAPRLCEALWAIRTTTMTREDAWLRWDVELEGGETRNLTQEVYSLGPMETAAPNDNWVEINQLWLRPSKLAPKGAVVTWSQNTLIEYKDWPYEHNMLPFVQADFLPGIGTREGRTWVTDLLDLQTDYNDNISREATIRRQLSPKLVSAIGQIDPQRVTSRVEHLQYMPGVSQNPPHLEMPNSGWAQQFELGMARDEADMGERAGVSEVSQGSAATTAPAASILALQDADDTKLALHATALASFIAEVGHHILLLAKQFWTEERTIRVWSQEDVLAAYRYSGSDIADGLDVHVTSESALPKSKAARAQLILELAARYGDLIQPQDVLRMLELPNVDFITRSVDADTKKQWREISEMLEGEACEVKGFDNHVVHLQVLNQFRKSSDYENLPVESQAIFDAHAAVHEMLVLKQLGMPLPTPPDPEAMRQAQMASAGVAAGYAPPEGAGAQPGAEQPGGVAPMSDTAIQQSAGIGQAAGQPGRVPGVPADNQAASMGG